MSRFSRKFAIDVDTLQQGDVIPTTQLIDLLGMTPENRRWGLRMQALKQYIESRRPGFVCREQESQLRVLEEHEKPAYLGARFMAHVRGMVTTADRIRSDIDTSKLEPALARRTESMSLAAGKIAQAAAAQALQHKNVLELLEANKEAKS